MCRICTMPPIDVRRPSGEHPGHGIASIRGVSLGALSSLATD
jgi:hypothetical protein